MASTIANVARTGLRFLANARMALPMVPGARVVTYHSVRPDGVGRRSAFVRPDDFEQHVEWLTAEGYRFVPLSSLIDAIEQGYSIPDHWVSLTFDDGLADNYIYAFPILKRLGLPATIFLIAGFIGSNPLYLSPQQVREMAHAGINFGAHTLDHVSLSSIPLAEAKRQITQSQECVAGWSERTVEHFCYPYGHFNPAIEGVVKDCGFRSCCTENAGTVTAHTVPFRLPRVGILGTDTLRDVELRLNGAYDWWIDTFMHVEEVRRRIRGGAPRDR